MNLISNYRHQNPDPSEHAFAADAEGIQRIFNQIRALPPGDGPNQLLLSVVDAIRRHFGNVAQVTFVDAATCSSETASAHFRVADTMRIRAVAYSTQAEFGLVGSSIRPEWPITYLAVDLGADHLDQLTSVLDYFQHFLTGQD